MPSDIDEVALALDGIALDGGMAYTVIAVGLAGDGSLDGILKIRRDGRSRRRLLTAPR